MTNHFMVATDPDSKDTYKDVLDALKSVKDTAVVERVDNWVLVSSELTLDELEAALPKEKFMVLRPPIVELPEGSRRIFSERPREEFPEGARGRFSERLGRDADEGQSR